MNQVNVFLLNNVPQHLAVSSERPELKDKDIRSVCGKHTVGMTVNEVNLPVTLACSDCQWQLEQWIKRANDHPDYNED